MNADLLLVHYEKLSDAPDAIPRLRRFILDLAVRGKLVEQDPKDEPAVELLKRIAKEKARLVKTGEIKKPKALPPVNEPPFEVPRNWLWTRMRQTSSDRGQKVPEADFTYIDVTSIDKERGVIASATVMPASQAPSRARKLVRNGDVVYSCVRPYLLNVAIVENTFDPPPIASTAFAILNGHGCVLPRFQWIVLRSPFMVACVEEGMRGQAYPAINDTEFGRLPFPLPPLAEQHRIVAKVDEFMALCNRLETARTEREKTRDRLAAASLARLDAPDPNPAVFQKHAAFALDNFRPLTAGPDQIKGLRQTILNLAVRGKLAEQDPHDEPASELLKRIAEEKKWMVAAGKFKTFDGDLLSENANTPFLIPANWTWCYLDDLAAIARGGSPRPIKSYLTDDPNGIPWIKIGDSVRGSIYIKNTKERIRPEGLTKSRMVYPGDLLLSNSMSFGYPYITNIRGCIHDGWLVIRTPETLVDKLYLHTLFISSHAKQIFSKLASGAVVQNLNADKAKLLSVPLPPLAEQRRIVAKVDQLMALCDRLETGLAATDGTRSRLLESLLHDALASAAYQPAAAWR